MSIIFGNNSPFVDETAAAAYRSAVMASSPVAYWRLSETSGTTAVDEVGSYDGTYVGSPSLGNAGPMELTSMYSNSQTAYMNHADNAALDCVTNGSVECWFKADSNTTFMPLVTKGYKNGWAMYYDNRSSRNALAWRGTNMTANNYFPNPNINANGQWNHAVITWDGTTIKAYSNGLIEGTQTHPTVANASNQVRISTDQNLAGYWLNGYICECAVYDTVLTSGDVFAHYSAAGL